MKSSCTILFVILAAVMACKRAGTNNNSAVPATGGKSSFAVPKSEAEIAELISINKKLIKDGDLLERVDDDMVSESMRNFSRRDKTFSHCGIAFVEDGEVYVYNNMAGEENKSEKMMRESYDSFVSPHKKSGFGIFRYSLSDSEVVRLHTLTRAGYSAGILFDKTFDLKTDDKMYCAEMVYKYLKWATNNRVVLPTTKMYNYRVRDPKYKGLVLKEFEYIGLDDLYLNTYCAPISRVSYQQQ